MIKRSNIVNKQHLMINGELNYIWGLPGSGKSTWLAAVAQCCYEVGIPCFSTYPIRHCYQFQGFNVNYPCGSVFLLDEIYDLIGSGTNKGILPADVAMFFKTFRHSRYTIWACSQEVDDVARRVRGVVTQAWRAVIRPLGVSALQRAVIREVKDAEGDKFELCNDSILGSLFDVRFRRSDFYDDFDSYCRKEYTRHAEFKSW